MLTLGQAAKQTGLSKSTISRAISSGKLSAVSRDRGGYSIDPSELFRVFQNKSSCNTIMERSVTPNETAPQSTATETVLKAEIVGLKALINHLEEQVLDLREQRNRWQEQAQATQRLLVDMRPRGGLFSFLKRSS